MQEENKNRDRETRDVPFGWKVGKREPEEAGTKKEDEEPEDVP